jgi:hypothetical protein
MRGSVQDRSQALKWISFWRASSHISALSDQGLVRIQDVIWRIWKWNIKLILNLCMNYSTRYVFSVQCEESRIHHLTLLLVVTMSYLCWFLWWANYVEDSKWRLCFQIGVAFWRVGLREVYFEVPNRVWRALKTSILNTDERLMWPDPPSLFLWMYKFMYRYILKMLGGSSITKDFEYWRCSRSMQVAL